MNPNIAGILAILMWSVSPLLIVGAGETPPLMMSFLTLFCASVFLFVRSVFSKHDMKCMIARSPAAYLLTFYGIGGYMVFWILGFKYAPAFEANILNYLWPILLLLFSHVVAKNALNVWKILGLLSGFAGVVLLFFQEGAFDAQVTFYSGYFFALIAAFIWASYSVATRYVRFSNEAMATLLLPPALASLCLHLGIERFYFPSVSEILFLFFLGVSRISFVFWDYAMKYGQIPFLSSLAYFIPVISTALLIVFGYLPQSETVLVGAIFVIAGCLIANGEYLRLSVRKPRI